MRQKVWEAKGSCEGSGWIIVAAPYSALALEVGKQIPLVFNKLQTQQKGKRDRRRFWVVRAEGHRLQTRRKGAHAQ